MCFMNSHIIDSVCMGLHWQVEDVAKIFTDESRLQYWLNVEAALARVQGRLGVIPQESAQAINEHAYVSCINFEDFQREAAETGHIIVPLVRCLQKACPKDHGEFVHFGATTQDIVDTGAVLQMRDAARYIYSQALRLESAILNNAKKYKKLVMAGRTHGQQGSPITMGFKFATWAAELRRSIERMKQMRPRVFVLMLHGAVGTQAGYGEFAVQTAQGVADELGLTLPPICWASSRDTVAEYLSVMGILAGTLARIANEILSLSTSEVGELREPMGKNTVGSSTMPHKRNANVSEYTVGQSRIVQTNALLGMLGQVSQHERDCRIWRTEFHHIGETSVLIAKMLTAMSTVMEGLEVDERNVDRNLKLLGGLLLTESVMFHLSDKLGKQTAHELLRELTLLQKDDLSFIERLHNNSTVLSALTHEEIDAIFDYSKFIGRAPEIVDEVAEYCASLQRSDLPVSAF